MALMNRVLRTLALPPCGSAQVTRRSGKSCVVVAELGTLDRKQIAVLVGLAPFAHQSGQWRGKTFIGQLGNQRPRDSRVDRGYRGQQVFLLAPSR
jgi:hypothetical protein